MSRKNFKGNFGTNYCFYPDKCINKKINSSTRYKPHCTIDNCTFKGDNHVRLVKLVEAWRQWTRN